jgi:t-SNARE complex subunit (syntaxin)
MEQRIARIEGAVEQMNERLNHLSAELRDTRDHFNNELMDIRRTMRNVMFVMLGILIPMWVTIILAIIFK